MFSLPVFAGCPKCPKPKPKQFEECAKTYVASDQISFNDQMIQVALVDTIVQTSAIGIDETGLFFSDCVNAWEPSKCPDGQWECPKCHACNANYNYFCQTCWN